MNYDKLMVVTHPDDESLFGGGELLKETGWLVVCVTNKDNKMRNAEFQKAMDFVGAEREIWDYEDKWNGDFDRPELIKDLQEVIGRRWWKKIVTHNLDGEYGHTQHIALSEVMHEIVGDNLFVFSFSSNDNETLPFELIEGKLSMLSQYKSQYFIIEDFKAILAKEKIIPSEGRKYLERK